MGPTFFARFGEYPISYADEPAISVGNIAAEICAASPAQCQQVPVARPDLTLLKSYLLTVRVYRVVIESYR